MNDVPSFTKGGNQTINEDAVAHMGRGRLTREELTILELVNGKHTVKEIIRQSRMGSFDVSKMLYRLLSIKLIRRRETYKDLVRTEEEVTPA